MCSSAKVLNLLLFKGSSKRGPPPCCPAQNSVTILTNDILLIAPSISELQSLFHLCKIELNWLDMSINEKKSCCIRIGPRSDLKCATMHNHLKLS